MYRVMIVEDDPMARQLLEIYVKDSPNYEIACCIESAAMAEVHCLSKRIDLILMDVCTAMNANGLEASKKIKKYHPEIKIVIITSQPEHTFISSARSIGVDSFWYKSATAEEILSIMDRTMKGESIYPETAPSIALGNALTDAFSKRELEVLRLVVEGEMDTAIAEKLYISVSTVKYHIQNMKERTGFRNRTELAVKARACGFIIDGMKQ